MRAALALAGAAVLTHELRYLIAFDGDASAWLGHDGHPLLALLSPALAVALGALLVRATRGRVALTGLGLLGIYLAQAALEGAIAPGHLIGFAGLAAHGGWIVLPLVLAFAWVAVRAAGTLREQLGTRVAGAIRRVRLPRAGRTLRLPRAATLTLRPGVGRHLASRPPPLAA